MTRALIAALLAVAAVAAAGCESGQGSYRTLTFQVFGDAEELAIYRRLVSAYGDRSGQRVDLIEVPDRDAHLAKLATSFAGGSPPDVFLVNYRNYAGFAAREVLDPVGPRLDRSRTLERSDFYPQPLEAFTYRGRLECLPQNASSLVTYFNRDLFREAGLPDPRPDWTFEDLRETARRLTVDEDRDGAIDRYGIGVEPSVVRLAAFVWAAGGDLVDDPSRPGRFVLDTPAAREGLQTFLDLQAGDRLAPTEKEVEARPLEQRFADGELAMFMSSRREVPVFREIAKFDWDVAAFPRGARRASVLHSDAFCMARSDGGEAAWEFVEFAGGPEGQRILARGGRTVPSLRAVAESEAFLDPRQRPRSSRVFLEAVPAVRRLPVASTWPEIEDAADLAIKRAYYNELTVEQALERIRRETDSLFERARSDGRAGD